MLLEITIDNKIKKRHYLESTHEFSINRILSSYGPTSSLVLREKIKDLLIRMTNENESESYLEISTIIEGITYSIKITKNKKFQHSIVY